MSIPSLLGFSLMLQDQGVRDTVVMIPAAVDRSFWENLAAGGQFAVSLVVLVLLAAVVIVLVALRKSVQELTRLLHSSYGDISAAAHSVRNVAEDVRGITQSVKTDFGAVSDTIRQVNTGVRKAVRRAELRLRRLDALVGVAQEEGGRLRMAHGYPSPRNSSATCITRTCFRSRRARPSRCMRQLMSTPVITSAPARS